ncbi:MAG: hypothetical protein AABZ30_00150 [Myxococcota bacterium]
MIRLLLVLVAVLVLAIMAMRLYPKSIRRARHQAAEAAGQKADGGLTVIDSAPATSINREIRAVRKQVEGTMRKAEDARQRRLDDESRAQ